MSWRTLLFFLLLPVAGISSTASCQEKAAAEADQRAWPEFTRRVHARFRGNPGSFAHFGDSITESLAFWSPLKYERKHASIDMENAFRKVDAYLRPDCWRGWKGPEFGNQGGQTARWGDENVGGWLDRLHPEVALVMFGSNDLRDVSVTEYRQHMRSIVRKCLDHGTIVILSTIPPRHGFAAKAATFAEAVRQVDREFQVPLVDFQAEILKRRPRDWDGAADAFRAYEGYDVPTLLAHDGLHPSAPQAFENDYSEEALRSHGYNLRNYLVLMSYAAVIDTISGTRPPAKPTRPSLVKAWYPRAPALKSPAGEVIRVASVEALFAAVRRVRPGGTILLAEGVYPLRQTLVIATDGVTLRSASGRRGHVILDGGGTLGELLTIRGCTGVTVADLLIQNVRWNGIKLDSDTGVQRVTIHNCVLHNIWQRGIKGVTVPEADRERLRPHGCRVEYCFFINDRPKRFGDDPADTAQSFGGDYISGIDVMFASGWTIADNVFVGIHGRTGSARGAIFLWHDCRDCVVERNVVVDCDSGICLGNSFKPPGITCHCTNVLVRNNFVTRAPENGILADFTCDCAFLHNTVHEPNTRHGRLIRLVHDNDGLRVENNLLSGHEPLIETQSRFTLRNNLNRDMSSAFVAPDEGNLRLTANATVAIDRAEPLAEVPSDIDGTTRGTHPDFGAHEFIRPAEPAPAPPAHD